MCMPVKCDTCGKTTWKGCGRHVDQVMANVPEDDRCKGHDDTASKSKAEGSST
ncbi:hypothetical protein M407DRAFT_22670 [Tulasnella calospora MUT 4182]|uniref:Uncharacterized protein n=1 Tax=Tulasnella calospora MUT 4182 TaxID=1051891 RepID=A0A0C3QL16_9AGAM|nr:hypothetical protein M407DRAFT_22670 [Tulasnella calospora MUT 4182]